MSSEPSRWDVTIVRHILKYCCEVEQAVACFGGGEAEFMANAVYRNAVSMPVQQIGELSKRLSDAFVSEHPEIPWRQIKGMRDWFAHQYLEMDMGIMWAVATEDLPPLRDFCEKFLARTGST